MTTPAARQQVRLRPDRTVYLAIGVFALAAVPLVTSAAALLPLALAPAACALWAARARVVAAPVGIEVCNGLRPHRFPWSAVEGFDLPRRGAPRLVLTDGSRLRMSAIDRRQLPRVLAVHDDAVRSR